MAACAVVRCAVVGHVEWTEFALVDHVPAPGNIAHAFDDWAEPAGGGSVVAVQIRKLAGTCDFITALGDDELGHRCADRLAETGLSLTVEWFGRTRRAITLIDEHRERTITTFGPKLRPIGDYDFSKYDLVFFIAGEANVLRAARAARFLAATTREVATLREGGVHLDLLIGSGRDPGEHYDGGLDAAIVVATEGTDGGVINGQRYAAIETTEPVVDTYGAGDSFAAALAFGLARGDGIDEALALAARAGAGVVTGKGPYTSQIWA